LSSNIRVHHPIGRADPLAIDRNILLLNLDHIDLERDRRCLGRLTRAADNHHNDHRHDNDPERSGGQDLVPSQSVS